MRHFKVTISLRMTGDELASTIIEANDTDGLLLKGKLALNSSISFNKKKHDISYQEVTDEVFDSECIMRTPQFEIGFEYIDKHNKKTFKVHDIYTTRNSKNEIIRIEYFVKSENSTGVVPASTIKRSVIAQEQE